MANQRETYFFLNARNIYIFRHNFFRFFWDSKAILYLTCQPLRRCDNIFKQAECLSFFLMRLFYCSKNCECWLILIKWTSCVFSLFLRKNMKWSCWFQVATWKWYLPADDFSYEYTIIFSNISMICLLFTNINSQFGQLFIFRYVHDFNYDRIGWISKFVQLVTSKFY